MINKKRFANKTYYGAVCSFLDKPVFAIGYRTCKVEFVKFLQILKSKVPDGLNPVFIFDSHRAHTNKETENMIAEWAEPVHPPYASC